MEILYVNNNVQNNMPCSYLGFDEKQCWINHLSLLTRTEFIILIHYSLWCIKISMPIFFTAGKCQYLAELGSWITDHRSIQVCKIQFPLIGSIFIARDWKSPFRDVHGMWQKGQDSGCNVLPILYYYYIRSQFGLVV